MEIFAIREDGFKFQALDLLVTDILNFFPDGTDETEIINFSFNNKRLSEFWQLRKTGWSELEGEDNLIRELTRT